MSASAPVRESVPAVLYTPSSGTGFGPSAWLEMAREVWHSRELIWRLFLRDLSARYRQSIFGYVWAVLPAIITVVTFTYLNRAEIFAVGETSIPYPAFVLLGITVWQLFATGLISTTQSLVAAGNLITKINFCREALVFAAFGQSLFESLIRLVLLVGVFVWYGVVPQWTVFWVPLMLVPLALMTLGLGFFLSLANAVFRDFGNAIGIVMTFAMLLTPVVYPPPTEWPSSLVNVVNPVSPFVIAARDLVIDGRLSQPDGLWIGSLVGVLIFLVGWRVFHLAMPRITERI